MRYPSLVTSVCVLLVSACGGSTSAPTTPSTPGTPTTPVQQNRAPSITSMTISPAFGIASLTQFSFSAAASDPDGDAISYAWDVAGNPFTGTSGTVTFSNGGDATARVTVTDSKGSSSSDTRTFVVGSMTGSWRVTTGQLIGATFTLSQSATGLVTGSFALPGIGNGNTDPAQPGRIDGNANVTMRIKIAPFTDFNMIGSMASTGRTVSGSLQGSGFTGQPFTLTRQ